MDGIYDLGGVAGFGSFSIEENEPVFHQQWEVFPYCAVFIGTFEPQMFNTDEYRHAVERIEASSYLSSSYYERVLTAAASLFVEKGLMTAEELEERAGGGFPLAQAVAADAGSSVCAESIPLAVGDRVRVRDTQATGHTRAPRYVRGRQGEVTHVTPAFTLPDAHAHGISHEAEPTYHVRFTARELWGPSAEENASVVVDLWQSYLERL
ncbi:MAG: nitrile hydratase [Pseudohongiella sp.]|nr:MAG: nitrile hydratase [Pseudohongiella sp.]